VKANSGMTAEGGERPCRSPSKTPKPIETMDEDDRDNNSLVMELGAIC